jgi:hypothetical protein
LAEVANVPQPHIRDDRLLPSLSTTILLGVCLAISMTAMMIVRMAFDLPLNPIRFIDVAFETVNTAASVGLLLLYFVSPAEAGMVALPIIAVTISMTPRGFAPAAVRLSPFSDSMLGRFFPRIGLAAVQAAGLAADVTVPVVALSARGG